MSELAMNRCDQCGRVVPDLYVEPGWLQVKGSVTRSLGRDRRGSAITDYLAGERQDYCSVRCLVAALDRQGAAERLAALGPKLDSSPARADEGKP